MSELGFDRVKLKQGLKDRLLAILSKHIELGDSSLSDRALVEEVVKRFKQYNDHYLVDVNE